MNRYFFLMAAGFFMVLQPGPAAAQIQSLPEAWSLALSSSPKLKQAASRVEQKENLKSGSLGNFLPSVSVQGSWNRLNDPLVIDLSPIREVILQLQSRNTADLKNLSGLAQGQAPLTDAQKALVAGQAYQQLNTSLPAFRESVKDQTYPSAAITAIQPLFTGGKLLAASRFAGSEVNAAGAEQSKIREDLLLETTRAWYSVLLMQELTQTRKDVLIGMKMHAREAVKAEAEGLISYQQRLRAEVAVAEAEKNLIQDQNQLELARLSLASLTGTQPVTALLPDSLVSFPLPDTTRLFRRGFTDQPVLRLLEAKSEAASAGKLAKMAEFLPTVALFGRYELFPDDLSVLEPRWIAGVSVSMNLFRGGTSWQDYQAASGQAEEIRYARDEANRQLSLWLEKSIRTIRNSTALISSLAVLDKQASENLRVAEVRFRAGLATSSDVIDARLVSEKIKTEQIKALCDYHLAVADCLAATGHVGDFLTVKQGEIHP